MAKPHDKQFKLDAVQYYPDHKELGVRGLLKILGVSRSGYHTWLKHVPSDTEKHRKAVKAKYRIFITAPSKTMVPQR